MNRKERAHVLSKEYLDLEPGLLWDLFAELAAIPRPSREEAPAREWVMHTARAQKGWETTTDREGNVLVRVPAKPGHEKAPAVILQAHLDMVTIKREESEHDFRRDPIRLRVTEHKGDRVVTADGTTLGADNGLGVVAALAVGMNPESIHGPLELILTTNEESGMSGARGLALPGIKGRLLINLDSEEDDAVYTGCVGRAECFAIWSKHASPTGQDCAEGSTRSKGLRIVLKGFPGGHSGLEIHQPRGNAILSLASLLGGLERGSYRVASLKGGSRHNALPDRAEATVVCTEDALHQLQDMRDRTIEKLQTELGEFGEEISLTLEELNHLPSEAMAADESADVVEAIACLPHGVLARSADDPDVIETSNNVAMVTCDRTNGSIRLEVECSLRSISEKEMRSWMEQIGKVTRETGGDSRGKIMYPPWKPDPSSKLVNLAAESYARVFGSPPRRAVIHGGLECALIGAKIPGVDMVSIGPRIEEPHTPRERVYIASVERFWKWLCEMLEAITQHK